MSIPRYSQRPFPAYAHVPGTGTVHPTRHPDGHSYGGDEEPAPFRLQDWATHEGYRFGIDLHNHGYHWECHEELEGVWRTTDLRCPAARFLQALIQLTVAHSYVIRGRPDVSVKLAGWAAEKLPPGEARFAGIDLGLFKRDLQRFSGDPAAWPMRWRLLLP